MNFASLVRTLPPRLATGAFILNSGVGKLSADQETAARLHGMASNTYPFLGKLKPEDFTRALAVGEIAVGTTLLLPVVPAAVAGAALTAFSGGLIGLYLHLTSRQAVDPGEAARWSASDEGRRFLTASSNAWYEASVAFGTGAAEARAAADRTTAFYTGVPKPGAQVDQHG